LRQQPTARREGVSAHFSNVYCTIPKEMTGRNIFNLPWWTSQQPLDLLSSNSNAKQNGGFLELFSRFRQGTEIQGFTESKNYFPKVFQITSRLVLVKKKKIGALCTLVRFPYHT